MTEHALNHRFRIIRAQCGIIRDGLAAGFDMKDLPVEPSGNPRTIEAVDKNSTLALIVVAYCLFYLRSLCVTISF